MDIWTQATELGLTYSGDSDPANGGVFYSMDPDDFNLGYIEAVRIEPCSDAGAQDNAYWLEWLTLNIPESVKEINEILRCCGYRLDSEGNIVNEHDSELLAEKGTREYLQVIAESCVSYGRYDKSDGLTIQVGYKSEGGRKSERIRASDIDIWLSDKVDFVEWLLCKVSGDSEKNELASSMESDRDTLKAEYWLAESLERQSEDCGDCPFRGKDCHNEDCPTFED